MRLIYDGAGQFRYGTEIARIDWEYPALATRLGWSIRRVQRREKNIRFFKAARKGKNNCDHRGTDGTVNCPDCGVQAMAFVEAAAGYLHERAVRNRGHVQRSA